MSKRALNLIKRAYEKVENYKSEWLEYERMYNSTHSKKYLEATKEQDRNSIFIPLTYSTINIANSIFTNAFFSNGNPIEITNVGESDTTKRDELTQVVEYYFKKSKPYTPLSLAFLSACIYGTGAVSLVWDENRPKTKHIPINSCAFDIDAISIEDNRYICHSFTQTIEDIKRRFQSGFYKEEADEYYEFLNIDNSYMRKTVQELYEKKEDGYRVTTFIDSKKVRETTFRRCPIKWGMLLPKLPSVDDEKRKNEVAAIGDSLVRVIKPLNEELNIKRNQRMDLIEKHLNPEVYVPITAGVDPDDALRVGGYKRCDDSRGILFAPAGVGAVEFTNDVQMLHKDIEDASSINGIMRGNTNASDRRSKAALATVNANSSTRLEAMIKMINETLFEEWARDFVRLIYINAPDELICKIIEKPIHSFGPLGLREELDFDININFGASLNRDKKIQDLLGIVQMVGNNPNANTTGIMEEIITLSLGENIDAKRILGISEEQGDGMLDESYSEQNRAAARGAFDRANGQGGELRGATEVSGNGASAWNNTARKNTL